MMAEESCRALQQRELLNFLVHCTYEDSLLPPTCALTQPRSPLQAFAVVRHNVVHGVYNLAPLWPFFTSRNLSLSNLYAMDREQLEELCRGACMTPPQRLCFTLAMPQFREAPRVEVDVHRSIEASSVLILRGASSSSLGAAVHGDAAAALQQSGGQGTPPRRIVCKKCHPEQFKLLLSTATSANVASASSPPADNSPEPKQHTPTTTPTRAINTFRVPVETLAHADETKLRALKDRHAHLSSDAVLRSLLVSMEADPFSKKFSENFTLDIDLLRDVVEGYASEDPAMMMKSTMRGGGTEEEGEPSSEGCSRFLRAPSALEMLRCMCSTPQQAAALHSSFIVLSRPKWKRGPRAKGGGYTISCEDVIKILTACVTAHEFLVAVFRQFTGSCPFLIIAAEVEDGCSGGQSAHGLRALRRDVIRSVLAVNDLAVISFEDVATAFAQNPQLQEPFVGVVFELASLGCDALPTSLLRNPKPNKGAKKKKEAAAAAAHHRTTTTRQ